MHGNARPGEPLHDRHHVALDPGLPQQPVAYLGVRGVDRNVERGESLRLDPVELRLLQIGQRDVVAVQEGEPEVVVLDVEALAHSSRQLVDEAEDALVGAGRDLRRAWRLQLEPQPWPASPEHGRARAASALDGHLEPLLARMEVEVDHVAKARAVDGEDAVAGQEPRPGRRPPRAHRRHHHPPRGRPCSLTRPARHDFSFSP